MVSISTSGALLTSRPTTMMGAAKGRGLVRAPSSPSIRNIQQSPRARHDDDNHDVVRGGSGRESDAARPDVRDVIEAVMASPVRSRLLTSTLEYSIETTMRQWRAERDGRGSGPMSGQHFRRWLNERLGRNLYVGDAAADAADDSAAVGYANGTGTGGKMSPGGMLLSTLGDRDAAGADGEGAARPTTTTAVWTGGDLAAARNHLRATLQRRLDVRCAVLQRHRVRVVTRPGPEGVDTNLVVDTDLVVDNAGGGGNTRAGGAQTAPAMHLAAALALDDEAFARGVAAMHREHRAAPPNTVMPEGPALTASDVKRTMWEVENRPWNRNSSGGWATATGGSGGEGGIGGNTYGQTVRGGGGTAPRSTYDVDFVQDRFVGDALP